MSDHIIVDLSSWKMRQHLDWTTAGQSANSVAGILDLNRLMATAITAWPYPGDPRQVESYVEGLSPLEWKECVASVERATQDAFRHPDVGNVQSGTIQPVG